MKNKKLIESNKRKKKRCTLGSLSLYFLAIEFELFRWLTYWNHLISLFLSTERIGIINNQHFLRESMLPPPLIKNKQDLKVKYNTSFFSIPCETTSVSLSPVGRLKCCICFWGTISVNQAIRRIIVKGNRIPFVSDPPPMHLSNNSSALRHRTFVEHKMITCLNRHV